MKTGICEAHNSLILVTHRNHKEICLLYEDDSGTNGLQAIPQIAIYFQKKEIEIKMKQQEQCQHWSGS